MLQSLFLFSQNREESEASYEIQGYFKNYQEFNLDTLKCKKFNYIRMINSIRGGFEFERELDDSLKQSIYTIIIDYPLGSYMRHKEYTVSVFSENDSIIGLINYDVYRGNINSYFDYEKLNEYIESHNKFYKTELGISDFVDQLKKRKIYGYSCGSNISDLPLEHDDIYFDNIRNAKYFRNWLTAFNPELQTIGVEALKYLEKNKKLPLSPFEKKIIEHIKTRNSKLLICGGCVVFPQKYYDEANKK